MAVRISPPDERWDDQEFYPLHEEDDVPETPPHEATVRELRNALAARFPGWFVTGNVCIIAQRAPGSGATRAITGRRTCWW